MAKVFIYEVEFNGIKGAITDQESLAAAIKKTNEERRKEDFGTDKYKQLTTQLGALKAVQEQVSKQERIAKEAFKQAADAGKNSYRGLNAELVRLRNTYKDLSEEERRSPFGEQTLKRIQSLDKELKGIDETLGNFQRNVGNYKDAFTNTFAQLSGFDLAALATIPGAVTAVAEVLIQAGQKVFELVQGIRELRGEISVLTNEGGDNLNNFTARVQALADTYKADSKQIVESANNVAKAFDISFGDALTRIEEGFIAGSDASGEFLQTAREYPALFKEAGLDVDQFFKILNRQATEGIFSDKGADVIKEAGIRLRELTPAALKALEGIGITEKRIREAIGEGGLAGGIALVAKQLKTVKVDSQEAGRVLADVFGGPGEDASVKFVRSLEDVNEATGSLIDTTNEYQKAQLKTLQVNQQFNQTLVQLSEELGGAGANLDDVIVQIQTELLKLLVQAIKGFKELGEVISPLFDIIGGLAQGIGLADEKVSGFAATLQVLEKAGKLAMLPFNLIISTFRSFSGLITGATRDVNKFLETLAAPITKIFGRQGSGVKGMQNFIDLANNAKGKVLEFGKETEDSGTASEKATKKVNGLTKAVKDLSAQAAVGSLEFLRKQVADLESQIAKAAPKDQPGLFEKLFGAKDKLAKAEAAQKQLLQDQFGFVDEVKKLSGLLAKEFTRTVTVTEDGVLRQQQQTEKGLRVTSSSLVERLSKIGLEISEASRQFTKDATDKVRSDFQVSLDALLDEFGDFFTSGRIFDTITQAGEAISGLTSARNEAELNAIEERYAKEIELAGNNTKKKEKLEKELAAEQEKIRKKEFEQQKRFRIASALSSLASGVVNILSTPSIIPDPLGALYKAAQIAFLTFSTTSQIAQISAQKAARGLFVQGPSHAQGGVKMLLNGQPVEVEGEEFVDRVEGGGIAVVNKRSSNIFKDVLQRIGGTVFPGKRKLLSDINSYGGFGVRYEQGGLVPNLDRMKFGVDASTGGSVFGMSEESVAELRNAVYNGAKEGVLNALVTANREDERNALANENERV